VAGPFATVIERNVGPTTGTENTQIRRAKQGELGVLGPGRGADVPLDHRGKRSGHSRISFRPVPHRTGNGSTGAIASSRSSLAGSCAADSSPSTARAPVSGHFSDRTAGAPRAYGYSSGSLRAACPDIGAPHSLDATRTHRSASRAAQSRITSAAPRARVSAKTRCSTNGEASAVRLKTADKTDTENSNQRKSVSQIRHHLSSSEQQDTGHAADRAGLLTCSPQLLHSSPIRDMAVLLIPLPDPPPRLISKRHFRLVADKSACPFPAKSCLAAPI
jgi:hypothetical protein